MEGSQPPPLARQGGRNQIEAAAASQPGAEKAPGAPETRKVDSICREVSGKSPSGAKILATYPLKPLKSAPKVDR